MAAGRHIAPAFHLPLQSGNDRVLHAMNRHYDMARYMDTVRYMREKIPDLTLTSDIIVGFPGETEAEFEDTLRALSDIRFDMIYSFIYSPRKGTPAAEMEQVPEEVQKNRFARMLELQNGVSMEKKSAAGRQDSARPVRRGKQEQRRPVDGTYRRQQERFLPRLAGYNAGRAVYPGAYRACRPLCPVRKSGESD